MPRRIAICAPATPITRDHAEAVTALAAMEFPALVLAFHDQCFRAEGHFAGADAVRLSAFLDCANDPASDAVWFAKGGYGSNRLLPGALDGLSGAARAKTYLGYSDGGFLLGALYARGIGQAVHAPMPTDIRRAGGAEAVRRTLAWLAGDTGGIEPHCGAEPTAAFNLTTLAMLLGTPHMPDLTGHVLMVEEVCEHLYAIDRLFFHAAALLPRLAGLRLGLVSEVPANDRPFGADAEEIAAYWCARAGIPYLGRAAIGHSATNRIVPFGLARSPGGA
ncbi:LD-carboxypeptidase [Qipengyuania sediminis]|uniref:LD-carboxypeptidase n=1 Tax=Qipengyuania sediminis TaxID=1532023 RepID=UPI001059A99B|nr:LD-carboxypeptidase [Qipengyuania sediminis]